MPQMLILLMQLLTVFGLLLWADRWLHRHLQGVLLLLTGDEEISLWLYAAVLLPGVILHELSHAVAAKLVRVKIGRIHILPRRHGKRIQLGFVPVEETDFLRASLIGAAPLIAGSIAVVALGHWVFGTPELVTALSEGDMRVGVANLLTAFQAPDLWLWVYVVFAISNTMLPSRSDIHAWPVLAFVALVVGGGVVLLGGSALILDGVGRFLTGALRWIVLLVASTLLVDLPIFGVIFLIEKATERVKGIRLEYR